MKLSEYMDNRGRKYRTVVEGGQELKPVPVNFMMIVYNAEDYLDRVLKSIKKQANKIYVLDNGSTDKTPEILKEHGVEYYRDEEKGDLSSIANKLLIHVPEGWTFIIDSDEVLFDVPEKHIGRYAALLEKKKITCSDIQRMDFIYNYGTLNAAYDWGDGPGKYWVARKLFNHRRGFYFKHKFHFNICNRPLDMPVTVNNNEHTGEWEGTVVKTNLITLFHYGKLRGIERMRTKTTIPSFEDRLRVLRGQVGTIPYCGPHPSVMEL